MSKGPYRYISVVEKDEHRQTLTLNKIRAYSGDFTRPVLFRNMVDIPPEVATRAFFEDIDPSLSVQWRRKLGSAPVTMRSKDGKTDYNYVTGQVGAGTELLDDIFEHKLDVYSHLGSISAGYKDPHEWGKQAFAKVKDEIFRSGWFQVAGWETTGHMFLGHSNHEFGEPIEGAVGSDWHMFPTLNVFVMMAGRKKWMTRPPSLLEQFEGDDGMFATSSGREAPGGAFDHDTVYVEPGDVLVNLLYEWHKVLNGKGFSLGGAFRVIDADYLTTLAQRRTLLSILPNFVETLPEDVAHLLTSLKYASFHLNRAQMMLNDAEHVYPSLLKAVSQRAMAQVEPIRVGVVQ